MGDVSRQMFSMVTTFCGCEVIGPKRYDLEALLKAGLITKNRAGTISYIAMGHNTSLAMYNSLTFGTEKNASEYRAVFGPNRRVAASDVPMGDSGISWDNQVFSIIMNAWSPCDLPPVPCYPETTQSPISSPTRAPSKYASNMPILDRSKGRENPVNGEFEFEDRNSIRKSESDPHFSEFVNS